MKLVGGILLSAVMSTPTLGRDVMPFPASMRGYVARGLRELAAAGTSIMDMSSGQYHTCAIDSARGVRCWGEGTHGRLGYGSTSNVGDGHGLSVAAAGTVNMGSSVTAIAISAGESHTCVIDNSGGVHCWGDGASGRLGYGNEMKVGDGNGLSVVEIGTVVIGSGVTAKAISAGSAHTCVIDSTDSARCWGQGQYGRLGYGSTSDVGDSSSSTVAGAGTLNFIPPTPSPTPTPALTATPSVTAAASPVATYTASPSASQTASPTVSYTATPSPSHSASSSGTSTVSPTVSYTTTPSPSHTVSPSGTATASSTASYTASASATSTASPTASYTASASGTPTVSPTASYTATPSPSHTVSPSVTSTASPTVTRAATASPSHAGNVAGGAGETVGGSSDAGQLWIAVGVVLGVLLVALLVVLSRRRHANPAGGAMPAHDEITVQGVNPQHA